MSELASVSMIMGCVAVLWGAVLRFAPATASRLIKAFPRNDYCAFILTAAGLMWAGWLMHQMPLGRFEHLKTLIYPGVPVLFLLMAFLMRELLAPRALGGLILLFCVPILSAARWHESAWRLVVTVSAYALIVWAMALVLSPYLFRKTFAPCLKSDSRCRALGLGLAIYGGALIALGGLVY